MGYRAFLSENRGLLAVGFLLCFFSSFGQTFFIGVFGGALRAEFGLSHGQFGTLYSAATLLSGTSLLFLGRGVDRHDLRKYAAWVCCGLSAACLGLAVANHVAVLFVALFALRFCGQGLMSHVAITTMARYFDAHRAKAISIASIGFAVGEATWPRTAIAALTAVDWRTVWTILAAIAALVLIPLVLSLLRSHGERHRAHLRELEAKQGEPDAGGTRQWTRAEVLRDPRFYLLLPAALAAPMIITGMFFHQVRVAELRDWSMSLYGNSFIAFAAAQFVTALCCGPLTDRLGANRVFPWMLIPMAFGMVTIATVDGAFACPLYLTALGVTAGAAATIGGALWAENYGVLHAGAIRALTSSLMVFSTALTPALMGVALDADVSIGTIAWAWVGYCAIASVLARIGVQTQ